MQENKAENVAIQALEWLALDQERLENFLGSSGANINDLKQMSRDSGFLAAVLDFILMADGNVMAFCDAVGLAYDVPSLARQSLAGGAQVNWT